MGRYGECEGEEEGWVYKKERKREKQRREMDRDRAGERRK